MGKVYDIGKVLQELNANLCMQMHSSAMSTGTNAPKILVSVFNKLYQQKEEVATVCQMLVK